MMWTARALSLVWGAFGVVGLTVNTGAPQVKEPALPLVWYCIGTK